VIRLVLDSTTPPTYIKMPVSLLTQAIQAARASGISVTLEDQPKPCSAPVPCRQVYFSQADICEQREKEGLHNTSTPIPNSRRFPPRDEIPSDDEGILPRDWVRAPARLHHPKDNFSYYHRAGTGGEGWEDLHAKRAIDGQKKMINTSICRGPFPAKEEERDPNKFYTRKLERKTVVITDLQWIEHWTKERELATKASAMQRELEELERRQANEAECEAKVWASGLFEKNAEGEWVRRDIQAEERMVLEKEENRWIEAEKQRIEEGLREERRRATEKAADELDRAWESKVKALQDKSDKLGNAFLDKEDRRITKRKRGGKGGKRPSRQWRVRVYPGETRDGVLRGGIRACG
jgi:hypothetical protein